MRSRTARQGFILMEMLGMLVILAAVALLVGDLIALMLRTTRETALRDTMIGRVDSGIDALRRDAWRAQAFRPRGDFVEIDLPEGMVVWNGGSNGLSRVQEG